MIVATYGLYQYSTIGMYDLEFLVSCVAASWVPCPGPFDTCSLQPDDGALGADEHANATTALNWQLLQPAKITALYAPAGSPRTSTVPPLSRFRRGTTPPRLFCADPTAKRPCSADMATLAAPA